MSKPVRIALDAFPYEQSIHRVCDYGGQQIYSKTALPLFVFRDSALMPLAAADVAVSSDFKSFNVRLRSDLRWSNGEQVFAQQYIDAFLLICCDSTNRYCNLLSDLEAYSIHDQDKGANFGAKAIGWFNIELKLRNPNKWFLHLLCQINLSPLHTNDKLSAGPYYVKTISATRYELAANEYYFVKSKTPATQIMFISYQHYERTAECIDDYLTGEIDVSCDTVMYFHDIPSYLTRGDFRLRWPALGMFLTPGHNFADIPTTVRECLYSLVDRGAIVEALHGIPKPIFGYSDLYSAHVRPYVDAIHPHAPCSLTLSFEDFYPNRIVAEILADQFSMYGITINLIEHEFGDWKTASHLRLSVMAGAGFGPLCFIKSDILKGFLSPEAFGLALKLYSAYLQLPDAYNTKLAFELEQIIHDHGLSLPLISFPSAALIRSYIDRESIYTVGTTIDFIAETE